MSNQTNNESNDKSKIISLGASDSEAKAKQQQQPAPLTLQQIQNIGAAYARLMELKDQKVVTVNTESELKGLIEFLSSELIDHADELIATWIVARTEYETLLNIFAKVASRVVGRIPKMSKAHNEGATK